MGTIRNIFIITHIYIYKDIDKCTIIFDSERLFITCVIMFMAHYEKTLVINNPFVIDPDQMFGKVCNGMSNLVFT